MNDTWLGIIKKELEQAIAVSGTAIVGAKLRQLVANAARAQGLTFPPPEIPRFSSLVESFPAEFIVQRFPGSDILIVPANRPELLVKDAPRSKNVRMRQDLFDAMTTVESHRKAAPYYLPDKDAVVWVDQNERLPASAVALPRASLDGELEARKKFIEVTAQSEAIRKSLDKALAGDSPLRFFGEAVRAHGLVKDWHQFRMGELTARLKRWSAETALPWNATWVESISYGASTPTSSPVAPDTRTQLALLASRLSNEDLARISVPLDVVLRVLTPKE